ncbi:MAG TPA: multicopper oxidase domain-containing protein [Terriglobales bacterium]|jgi:FtsP/CotA-like multicopper oxidase with cupredoxin domain
MFRPNRSFSFFFLLLVFLVLIAGNVFGQEMCPPRPRFGATIPDPLRLHSENGVLSVDLTEVNNMGDDGTMHYCYLYADGSEAPVLELNAGDQLVFNITNHLTPLAGAMPGMKHGGAAPAGNPCAGGAMSSASTNVHFHGLNISPKCHQDEVIRTSIQPSDPPFQYKIQIPKNDAPGLYWYHPHPHGFTTTQIVGGAAGALIIDGIQNFRPEVAGLPERVFVLRQMFIPPPPGSQPHQVNPLDNDSSPVTVNFVPAFSDAAAPVLHMKPGTRQLWRILNATSIYFFALQFKVDLVAQDLQVIALDGIPLNAPRSMDTVVIPPAGRAEFVVQAPPEGSFAQFMNLGFDTGPIGDLNQGEILANVTLDSNAEVAHRIPPAARKMTETRFAGLATAKPTQTRKLYFSEQTHDGNTDFFLTVKGQTPKVYDPDNPPAIITQQGSVEDWILENHSGEVHAFHIHQVHFVVLEINGVPTNDPAPRDTVLIPYWDGVSKPFPSVKVRLDFRNPETAGTFLYHCHILDHEDGGMMAKILVQRKN